jgi:hypothetical protein
MFNVRNMKFMAIDLSSSRLHSDGYEEEEEEEEELHFSVKVTDVRCQ